MGLLAVKTGSLHLDSNQGRQIAGPNALPLSYRVSQVLTSDARFWSEHVATIFTKILDSCYNYDPY